MARADGGVPSEGQLTARGEDADSVVSGRIGWRQHKGGFRQVGPVRELRHLGIGEAVGIEDYRHRIAECGLIREDVDLRKASHGRIVTGSTSAVRGQCRAIGTKSKKVDLSVARVRIQTTTVEFVREAGPVRLVRMEA